MTPFLPEFEHFLILAQTENISRAAELVGIKQSGLSKSLQRVERRWGTKLFSRSKQGLRLTAEGKKAYKILTELKNKWSTSLREETETVDMGSVKLGCHTLIAQTYLSRFHPRVIENYPGVFIELDMDRSVSVTRKVIMADLDIGIVINPQRHPELVIYPLQKERVCLWKSKGIKKSSNTLYYNPDLVNIYSYLKDYPNYRQIAVSDYITIGSCVLNGSALGILPSAVANFVGNLEPVKDFFESNMCLIYRKDRSKNRIMQTLIREIKTGFL